MDERKKRGACGWIALGCGAAIAIGIVFVGVIVAVAVASMRSSIPYKDALALAQRDPRVAEVLGTPVEAGLFTSGSVSTENRSGSADLDIPIHGPKGKASIHVVATREGGRWSYTRMIVTPDKGAVIDLLAPSPGESRGTAPPGA